MAAALSLHLYGELLPVGEWPVDLSVRGLGLSDWSRMEAELAKKVMFINTFFHREPFLDIQQVPEQLHRRFDFVISSEVFEHVAPPVEQAFAGALSLLKPGGALLLTVPHYPVEKTVEHFPGLRRWQVIEESEGVWIVESRDPDGQVTVFRDPIFHGGGGTTLEMRRMAASEIERIGREVGFSEVVPFDLDLPQFGVVWDRPHSMWPYLLKREGGLTERAARLPLAERAAARGLQIDSGRDLLILVQSIEARIYPSMLRELASLQPMGRITVAFYAPDADAASEADLLERAALQAGVSFDQLPDPLLLCVPAGRAADWAAISDCVYSRETPPAAFLAAPVVHDVSRLQSLLDSLL